MTNQKWNAAEYKSRAAYVAELGKSLLAWLQPEPGEKILDLGCGNGTLTLSLIESGAEVRGIDADASMIAAAREHGIDAEQRSATELDFDEEFDAVFSNAALHWMQPPEKVVEGVYRALKPGGRFVAEFGGAGNVEIARSNLVAALNARGLDGRQYDPWYFPTAEAYQQLLESHGFEVTRIELYERPTPIGERILDWLRNFAGTFVEPIPESERAAFLDEVGERMLPSVPRDEQGYLLDYVRLRFIAIRK
ncbi:MAG: SAM-dependent methyltransferase [Planctomyces sp.]|nr:SAM-dependent methyltransferase [Planctomyces sp.]